MEYWSQKISDFGFQISDINKELRIILALLNLQSAIPNPHSKYSNTPLA